MVDGGLNPPHFQTTPHRLRTRLRTTWCDGRVFGTNFSASLKVKWEGGMMSTLGTFEPCWLLLQMVYGREEALDQPQCFPGFWSGRSHCTPSHMACYNKLLHPPAFPDMHIHMQVLRSVDGQQSLQP